MSGRARRGALPEREVVREVEGDGERQRIHSGTQIASLRRIGFNRRALKLQVVCCVSVLLAGKRQGIAVRERPLDRVMIPVGAEHVILPAGFDRFVGAESR